MKTESYNTTITLPVHYKEMIYKLADKNDMSVDAISSLLITNILNSNYDNLSQELEKENKLS